MVNFVVGPNDPLFGPGTILKFLSVQSLLKAHQVYRIRRGGTRCSDRIMRLPIAKQKRYAS